MPEQLLTPTFSRNRLDVSHWDGTICCSPDLLTRYQIALLRPGPYSMIFYQEDLRLCRSSSSRTCAPVVSSDDGKFHSPEMWIMHVRQCLAIHDSMDKAFANHVVLLALWPEYQRDAAPIEHAHDVFQLRLAWRETDKLFLRRPPTNAKSFHQTP